MKKLLCTGAALTALAPAAPAAAGPIAGVRDCPSGHVGVIVYHVDYNTGGPVDLVRVCVPVEQ